jgi:hypothetical protein
MAITFIISLCFGVLSLTSVVYGESRRVPWRNDDADNLAIRFSSEACDVCNKDINVWNENVEEHSSNVKMYNINCDEHETLCKNMNVSQYPSIRLRSLDEWHNFYLHINQLNTTLSSFPKPCNYDVDAKSCHPIVGQWIEKHSEKGQKELEKEVKKMNENYSSEEKMFKMGITDLSKRFMEKKIIWKQVNEWQKKKIIREDAPTPSDSL